MNEKNNTMERKLINLYYETIDTSKPPIVHEENSTKSSSIQEEDSNNIVPTQKAVTTFLATRLSEGGSEIETNQLTAGLVRLGGPGNVIEHTAGFEIQFPKTTNIAGPEAGITGNPLYMRLFLKDD